MLILEWDKSQLTALTSDTRISKVLAWPNGERIVETDSGHSSWLKGELAEFLGKESKVTLVFPREDAILRHLELPPTPEDEVLDVVTLQTTMRSSVALDQVLLDYLPLNVKLPLADELTPSGHMRTISPEEAAAQSLPSSTLHVLVATISSSFVRNIQQLLDSVGFTVVHVALSSCGYATLLRQALDPADQAAFVCERVGRVETTAFADGQLLFAHSARVPHGARNEQGRPTPLAVGAEISRGLFAARRIAPEFHPRRLIIASGSEVDADLKEALASQFECRVEEAQELISRTALAATASKLVADAKGHSSPENAAQGLSHWIGCLGFVTPLPDQCRLDFLHPRKPAPKPDYRRVKLVTAATAALILTALGVAWQASIIASLDEQLLAMNVRNVDTKTTLKNGEGDQKVFVAVDDWQRHAPKISVELSRQAKVLPNTERLLWTNWSITAGAGEVYGRMQASGLARTNSDVTELGNRMAETKEYRIVPRELAGISKDPDYKQRFEIDATLLPPAPPPKPAAPAKPAGPAKDANLPLQPQTAPKADNKLPASKEQQAKETATTSVKSTLDSFGSATDGGEV